MKKFPLYKALPSLITISAFIFGFNAIKLAISGNIKGAIFSVLIASILDLFDGRVARMLRANSQFGAELDSLSDLVCFGIATSFIVLFSQDVSSKFLYYSSCFFSIGAMLRLARFNVASDYSEDYKNFFIGIPTPAGFFLGILPICFEYSFHFKVSTTFYAIYLIVIGFLMVSQLPTPSTKGIKAPRTLFPLLLGLCALIMVGLIMFPWISITILGFLYILSIIVTLFIFTKRKRQAS